MKCIVVDDSKLARTTIKHLITQVDFLEFKGEFESPVEALNYLEHEPVDLVFLDVEMPGMSGLELLKNLEVKPIVILVTAKQEYAVEAFEMNVADYIIKPVKLSRFISATHKAKKLFESREQKIESNAKDRDHIFVRSHAQLIKIRIKDIIYIQALGDYVNIFTADKHYAVHITLKGMEEKLGHADFYRLHRSYIIAIDQIDNVEEHTVKAGKYSIPIGEQYKKGLLAKLNLL